MTLSTFDLRRRTWRLLAMLVPVLALAGMSVTAFSLVDLAAVVPSNVFALALLHEFVGPTLMLFALSLGALVVWRYLQQNQSILDMATGRFETSAAEHARAMLRRAVFIRALQPAIAASWVLTLVASGLSMWLGATEATFSVGFSYPLLVAAAVLLMTSSLSAEGFYWNKERMFDDVLEGWGLQGRTAAPALARAFREGRVNEPLLRSKVKAACSSRFVPAVPFA
ncbi:hypothetical protein LC612_29390 [Nostoc sp. CHAB 5834]|nr:hypothetical protein [Nostoc sp. CHAB 5834]